MEILNLLIIVGAVFVTFLLWIILGIRHLKFLKCKVREQWNIILEGLAKRVDLLPNLIETLRRFDNTKEVLIERAIQERIRAAREYIPNAKKIEYEHDLTTTINEIIDVGKSNNEMSRDTNFLELKKEIDDLEQNIEEKTKKYNQMVREYNSNRKKIYLRPLAWIGRFHTENIFDVEV